MSSADVWTGTLPLPHDSRLDQCRRAADYIEAHPGCTLRELDAGSDLGSASKVTSEMRLNGYVLRTRRERVACADGRRSRNVTRHWLESRPVIAQPDLFAPE